MSFDFAPYKWEYNGPDYRAVIHRTDKDDGSSEFDATIYRRRPHKQAEWSKDFGSYADAVARLRLELDCLTKTGGTLADAALLARLRLGITP